MGYLLLTNSIAQESCSITNWLSDVCVVSYNLICSEYMHVRANEVPSFSRKLEHLRSSTIVTEF